MYPQIIPYFCVGYIAGVILGSTFSPVVANVFYLLFSVCFIFCVFGRYQAVRYGLIFSGSLLMGLVFSDLAVRSDVQNMASWKNVAGNISKYEGRVQSVEEDGLSLKVQVENVKIQNTSNVLPGVLEIKTAVSESIQTGDDIQFIGKIAIPDNFSLSAGHFDPRRYYARYGIFATMLNPRIQVMQSGAENKLTTIRNDLREKFFVLLPEPDAGLFSATLLGYMRDVPKSLRTDFSNSGLAHLVAISGQHVSMLAIAIFFITTMIGVPRIYAMIVTAVLATLFIALVDFPPSGIRSVIMVAAVYIAMASGRKSHGVRILLVTVVLMLMANPRILLADLGFQLSALAMWGLIVFYPIGQRFTFRAKSFGLQNIFLMTACAMFTTTPIIAYSFGRVSLIGLLANVFAAPLYPPLMLLGVAVLIFGWIPFLQGFLFFITHALTDIFLGLVEFSAKLPGANIQLVEFKAGYLVLFYFLLFVLSIILSRSTRRQFWPIRELFSVNKNSVRTEQLSDMAKK
ncbi:MAG: ComEC/Rec2 family competence protein [bacterium]|nr:ComEC/Rec2 family competence protein [bacterium]